MPKLTYRQRQIAKYRRAYKHRSWRHELLPHISEAMFRAVEAGIESITAGRQNRTTHGWELAKSIAHTRAAATIR